MNLVHLLLRSARRLPERPALAVGRHPVRVSRLASGLTEKLSLRAGDRVALAAKNCPE